MDFNKLQTLRQRLDKIAQAKKMNKEIQDILRKRLQVINSELYILSCPQQSYPSNIFFAQLKIFPLSEEEKAQLVQAFWKKGLFKNDSNNSNVSKIKMKKPLLTKRDIFMNFDRTSRQECLLFDSSNIQMMQRSIPSPIRLQPTFCDCIRYHIALQVYGKKFQIREIYPTMDIRKVKTMIKNCSKKGGKNLDEIGFDSQQIQEQISNVLKIESS